MQLVKKLSTQQIMLQVIIATLPIIATMFFVFGTAILVQISLAILTAVIIDFIAAKLQKHKPLYFISEYSSILTAILLAISIPTIASPWIIIVGVSFALIFAKYLYGGLGNNIFNPAMVGYAFLLISYPVEMTSWQVPTMNFELDAISGATLLDSAKNSIIADGNANNIIFITIASLLGGAYLLLRKIITWHIPVFMVLSFVLTMLSIQLLSDISIDLYTHLIAGSLIFAAFFIATDPVSTCSTIKGRIIFAILVGFLIAIIRVFGNYPDAIAFAILIANMSVPLIDYYIK